MEFCFLKFPEHLPLSQDIQGKINVQPIHTRIINTMYEMNGEKQTSTMDRTDRVALNIFQNVLLLSVLRDWRVLCSTSYQL